MLHPNGKVLAATAAVFALQSFTFAQPTQHAATSPATTTASSQPAEPPPNYDEAKVTSYTLPDPLTACTGHPIADAKTWNQTRRPELIKLFEENQYGISPPKPADLKFEMFDDSQSALDGKAIRKQFYITFAKPNAPRIQVLMYLPASAKTKPAPVFLCLHFSPVYRITTDPAVRLSPDWDHKKKETRAPDETKRGSSKGWPIDTILARGYGIAVMCYDDIEPDIYPGGLEKGVRAMYTQPGEKDTGPTGWGAIAAWGWGLSRAQDYLESDPQVDSRHTIILGHSRLGKTVMWAGARDTRFAMVVASCSGEGGAALSRRLYGETVEHMNRSFPYQFARNYQLWGKHVNDMPIDAHELVALIAPRPLFLNTGSLDQWSDPKGEFLAAQAATPVYELFGLKGLTGAAEFPALDTALLTGKIGFQCHTGKHEILTSDWDSFLKFADLHLYAQPSPDNPKPAN